MNTTYEFKPSEHQPIKEYGILAKPLSKRLKVTQVGPLKIAQIYKKNLGIGQYQRPQNKKKIANIRGNWNPELGEGFKVAEILHDGKWYHQVVDGQHRACACPQERVTVTVINSVAPVDNFLEANNPKNKSTISVDDRFFALKNRQETVNDGRSKEDRDDVSFMYEEFIENGYTPQHDKEKDKNSDFGCVIARIWKSYDIRIREVLDKAIAREQRILQSKQKKKFIPRFSNLSSQEIVDKKRDTFKDVMKIMLKVFNRTDFGPKTTYTSAWEGMMMLLTQYLNWDYNVDSVINILKKGRHCKNNHGKEKNQPLTTIEDWNDAVGNDYQNIEYIRDKWEKMIIDVYSVSQRP
jgi:hypothetical protein